MKKIWSKRFSIRLAENWLHSIKEFKKIYGMNFPEQRMIIENGIGTGYFEEKSYNKTKSEIRKRLYGQGFEDFFEKEGKPILENFLEYCQNLQIEGDLSKLLKEYIKKENTWMNIMWMAFILDEIITEDLVKENFSNEEIEAIVSNEKETAALSFKIDTLSGLSKEEMQKKYSFFNILNMDEDPLTEFDTEHSLDKIKEMKERKKYLFKKYKKILEKTRNKPLVEAAHKISFYREYRNDIRQKSYFYSRNLFIKIAEKLNISISDLIFMTQEEILNALKNNIIPISEIKERKKYVSVEVKNDKTYLSKKKINEDKRMIEGIIGNKGNVKGKVIIIRNIKKDSKRFKKGDIIVTPTTNLAFLPLISKCSGIITDEGGYLCHAAIVARELGIPCIVGTNNATKVFKDGEIVEIKDRIIRSEDTLTSTSQTTDS